MWLRTYKFKMLLGEDAHVIYITRRYIDRHTCLYDLTYQKAYEVS